jgi:hypothetical protein
MLPEEYGNILEQKDNVYFISLSKKDTVLLTKEEKYNKVKYFKNNVLVMEWKDIYVDSNKFLREIGKSTYYYTDNKQTLHKFTKSTKPITPLINNSSLIISNKIITMDIETITIDNIQIPYLISWFDGDITKSYYIDNKTTLKDQIKLLFKEIFIRKYRNYKVYFHNFSQFDSIFLLKVFSEVTKEKGGTIKPLIFNDKLLSLQITYNNYTLTFKDSLLLLPSSLSKLCKSFGLEENKGIFPFKLNNIHYFGRVPSFSDHINVSYDDYMEFYKDFYDSHGFPLENKYWYFKEETIKYCLQDCKVLYQILIKFNILTFDSFNINIDKYPTLSSLSASALLAKLTPRSP